VSKLEKATNDYKETISKLEAEVKGYRDQLQECKTENMQLNQVGLI